LIVLGVSSIVTLNIDIVCSTDMNGTSNYAVTFQIQIRPVYVFMGHRDLKVKHVPGSTYFVDPGTTILS